MNKTKHPLRPTGRGCKATWLAVAAFACCCGSYAVAQDAMPAGPIAGQPLVDIPAAPPLPVAQSAMEAPVYILSGTDSGDSSSQGSSSAGAADDGVGGTMDGATDRGRSGT